MTRRIRRIAITIRPTSVLKTSVWAVSMGGDETATRSALARGETKGIFVEDELPDCFLQILDTDRPEKVLTSTAMRSPISCPP